MDSAPQQEDSKEEEVEEGDIEREMKEGEKKKVVGDDGVTGSNINVHDISIRIERRNIVEDRRVSSDAKTQQYLDRLIRGDDSSLLNGLSMAMLDYFEENIGYPDASYAVLEYFVTGVLGLIDVPPRDLRNLMYIISDLRKNIEPEEGLRKNIEPPEEEEEDEEEEEEEEEDF